MSGKKPPICTLCYSFGHVNASCPLQNNSASNQNTEGNTKSDSGNNVIGSSSLLGSYSSQLKPLDSSSLNSKGSCKVSNENKPVNQVLENLDLVNQNQSTSPNKSSELVPLCIAENHEKVQSTVLDSGSISNSTIVIYDGLDTSTMIEMNSLEVPPDLDFQLRFKGNNKKDGSKKVLKQKMKCSEDSKVSNRFVVLSEDPQEDPINLEMITCNQRLFR